jgi:hypothetical protein
VQPAPVAPLGRPILGDRSMLTINNKSFLVKGILRKAKEAFVLLPTDKKDTKEYYENTTKSE